MQQVAFPNNSVGLSVLGIVGVAVFVGFLCLSALFVFLMIRNGQRRREWDHAERMRSLEMGLSVPPRDAPWAKAAICIAIGAGVPLISFVVTAIAFSNNALTPGEIWIAPGLVSGASVIGTCILAGVLFQGGSKSSQPTDDERTAAHLRAFTKPAHDPDAVDVVGRRG